MSCRPVCFLCQFVFFCGLFVCLNELVRFPRTKKMEESPSGSCENVQQSPAHEKRNGVHLPTGGVVLDDAIIGQLTQDAISYAFSHA